MFIVGPKNRSANEKKSYFCWWRKSWSFFLITLFMNMKTWTILLFSGSLSKICCTKLDLLQDIRQFYGELFDVHGFLKCERRHQSIAFNSLATQWVFLPVFCIPDARLGFYVHKEIIKFITNFLGSVMVLPQSSLNLHWYDFLGGFGFFFFFFLLLTITQWISCHVFFISFLVFFFFFSNLVNRYILFDLRISMFNLFL